jgi:cytochrome c biogenesis protein CcmG/thiol:disulfide interchange protein DsbE
MKRYFLIPLALFLVLAVFLAMGLNRDPHEVPSPLVGQPAPRFSLLAAALQGQARQNGIGCAESAWKLLRRVS